MCIENQSNIDITNKEEISDLFERYSDTIYEEVDKNDEVRKLITEARNNFHQNLTPYQIKQFEKLDELNKQKSDDIDKGIFIYAFSLGIKLMLEAMK